MNLRTKIGVVAVLLSTLTVQAQNIPFRKAEIKETMKKVADWQIANPNKGAEHGDLSWTNAVKRCCRNGFWTNRNILMYASTKTGRSVTSSIRVGSRRTDVTLL